MIENSPQFEKNNNVFDVSWSDSFDDKGFVDTFVNELLFEYIHKKRWYAGKSSRLKYIEISHYIKHKSLNHVYFTVLIEIHFYDAFFQNYFIPLAFLEEDYLDTGTRIGAASFKGVEGFLVDALHIEDYRKVLFDNIIKGGANHRVDSVIFHREPNFNGVSYESSRFLGVEQSNTSIVYNEKYILKIFRRIFISTNPDYEISRFLLEKTDFSNTPSYRGSINLSVGRKDMITIGLLQDLVPNQGDAWKRFSTVIHDLFKKQSDHRIDLSGIEAISPLYKVVKRERLPQKFREWVGEEFIKDVEMLAYRTAEMHVALGGDTENTSFVSSIYNGDYEVWLKNRLIFQFENRLSLVENNYHKLTGHSRELAKEFLERKSEIRRVFLDFDWTLLKGERTRIHGDYHLGQILFKDNDFFILDFEGEPESTIRDRKVKQPPIKDVAGLFRSFHYAVYSVIFNHGDNFDLTEEEMSQMGSVLYQYMTSLFMNTYTRYVQSHNLNIGYKKETNFILKYCLLEKAVYELGYELNSRPRWAIIPLKGILDILNENKTI